MTDLYRSLVSKHQDQVYSLARYLLADASEAEDVAQETFIKLWKNLENIGEAHIVPWLLKVTRNGCLDRLRARKALVELDEQDLPIVEKDEPSAIEGHRRMQETLMAMIQSLEEPWRSLLILRDIHEHSYESVGEILELKPNQVKVYLHRARNKLAELFEVQQNGLTNHE